MEYQNDLMCIKNGKSRVGDKRELEEHKDSEEPKLTKSRKLNDESGKISYEFNCCNEKSSHFFLDIVSEFLYFFQ